MTDTVFSVQQADGTWMPLAIVKPFDLPRANVRRVMVERSDTANGLEWVFRSHGLRLPRKTKKALRTAYAINGRVSQAQSRRLDRLIGRYPELAATAREFAKQAALSRS